MLDFLIISTRAAKRGVTEIYPKFRLYPKSSDLMVRGGDSMRSGMRKKVYGLLTRWTPYI